MQLEGSNWAYMTDGTEWSRCLVRDIEVNVEWQDAAQTRAYLRDGSRLTLEIRERNPGAWTTAKLVHAVEAVATGYGSVIDIVREELVSKGHDPATLESEEVVLAHVRIEAPRV